MPGGEGGEGLGPAGALAVDLGGPETVGLENVPELLAGADQGQEHHRPPPGAVGLHLPGDLVEAGFQGAGGPLGGVVPGGEPHAGQVQLEGHRLGQDGAEVAFPHGVGQLVFVGQGIEQLAEVLLVAPVGGAVTPSTRAAANRSSTRR